jgi:hypothetical protein
MPRSNETSKSMLNIQLQLDRITSVMFRDIQK